MESRDKGAFACITSADDRAFDKESCSFFIRSGDALFCVVDDGNWARTVYKDGEFTSSRFFRYTPMFFSESIASSFIEENKGRFFSKYDYDKVAVRPLIVTLQQAAIARIALYESLYHEWGE